MAEKQTTAVAKPEATASERFTNMIIREFSGLVSTMDMTQHQRRLARHLFIKIDTQLKDLETKRLASNETTKLPLVWANMNMAKLAIDTVHRVELGLDALIPNHIHPIPYFNKRGGTYDLDLRVGYAGKDFYRRRAAAIEPIDIIYELVYSTDAFRVLKRNAHNKVEGYEFEITKPFDRGEIVGGFGYVVYQQSGMNRLVLVSERDFQRAENLARATDFWRKHPVQMKFKTLVHRTTETLSVDPRKVDESYWIVESQDNEAEVTAEIVENANKELIDVDTATGEIIEDELPPEADNPEEGQQEMMRPEF